MTARQVSRAWAACGLQPGLGRVGYGKGAQVRRVLRAIAAQGPFVVGGRGHEFAPLDQTVGGDR